MKNENLKLKIVFFGNTKFSLIGAKIIYNQLGLSCIVTLPDKPDKKGQMIPNPLKNFALEHQIPFLEVETFESKTIDHLRSLKPDFFVVEDYGLILPESLLKLPKVASLNIHHSLLPKYRGPSPAPFAILAGDKQSGVTVIKMSKKVDAGDILAQRKYTLKPNETTESLLTELNNLGGELIVPVLRNYAQNKPIPQDESLATYTKLFTKQDGYIDLSLLNKLKLQEIENWKVEIDRKIRAFYPWPAVWTKWQTKNGQWKMIKFLPEKKLQVEGKNPVSLKDFINGYPDMREIVEKAYL